MYEEQIAFLRWLGAVYEGNTIDEDDKKDLLDAADAIERLELERDALKEELETVRYTLDERMREHG